jgi:hypothetical protein
MSVPIVYKRTGPQGTARGRIKERDAANNMTALARLNGLPPNVGVEPLLACPAFDQQAHENEFVASRHYPTSSAIADIRIATDAAKSLSGRRRMLLLRYAIK